MNVCITAKAATIDAPVEERFGRSPYFIIIDEDTEEITSIANEHAETMGGAGPKSAQILINRSVKTLITGQIGGNAQKALNAAGIMVYRYKEGGSVKEALSLYRQNKLERLL